MADYIPSFFTRADFWVMLLPGYLSITLGLFLFSPDTLSSSTSNEPTLLLVVIFIVAGPAVGFILWHLYIVFSQLGFNVIRHPDVKYEFLREFSRLRASCKEEQRTELDVIEAQYQLGISTGIALLIIVVFYTYFYYNDAVDIYRPMVQFNSTNSADNTTSTETNTEKEPKNYTEPLISLLFITGVSLILISTFYNRRVRLPVICGLMKEYCSIRSTEVCRTSNMRMENLSRKRRQRAKDRIEQAREKVKSNDVKGAIHYLKKAYEIDKDSLKEELDTEDFKIIRDREELKELLKDL